MRSFKRKVVGIATQPFNAFFDLFIGGKKRPIFFNIERTNPKLIILDDSFNIIKGEFDNLCNNISLNEYHKLDKYQHKISASVNPKKKWKIFLLAFSNQFSKSGLKYCPKTCSMLQEIPGLFQAFFSVLEPQKSIPAHKGVYRGYIRYHLTIYAPDNSKSAPFIRVKDKFYTWRERESILFDDSFDHEVVNLSDKERTILIVDILRPMPYVPRLVNQMIATIILKPFYGKKLLKEQEYNYA
ncbi:aspartyl/asparaginyl beta-hydroxylase domain-containing protein [Aestuariivivens marinum]|uniref:aspartyl/asparaginyl beta-hydroxylase domain-containing protein n=1 Tax=Aestuariivivens marinum TaxID=2913555 RepID=UPI001F597E02|nr:aspartyl/asparaginyl beta-hydroxylase domain-containing protein [Aestuariivivens marinum]